MKKIALLHGDSFPPFPALLTLKDSLEQNGYRVDLKSWTDTSADWKSYDAVIIRETYNYFLAVDAYRAWLKRMKEEKIALYNAPDLVLWNLEKTYLRDLAERNIPVIPTVFIESGMSYKNSLAEALEKWPDAESFIIKPAVSAGAYRTLRLDRAEFLQKGAEEIAAIAGHSNVLLQPFMPEICEGEIALVFFNGVFSYAIHKRPAPDNIYVQAKLGGTFKPYTPTPEEIEAGRDVLACLPETPLYARVDGISRNGVFTLMELEINEPGLYEQDYPDATALFVQAIKDVCR